MREKEYSEILISKHRAKDDYHDSKSEKQKNPDV